MYRKQEFDLKDPVEKYDLVTNEQDDNVVKCGRKILISLYVINEVLMKAFTKRKYLFYVYDDSSCKKLIEEALGEKIPDEIFFQSLIDIDLCKLIYRFTCAKKFCVKDTTIKQLRLNSWGNEYITVKNLIDNNKEIYNAMYLYFERYFSENKLIYDELLGRLLEEINYSNAEKIKELNNKVNIKILS